MSCLVGTVTLFVAQSAWAAQPGEKRINRQGGKEYKTTGSPTVVPMSGGDISVQRVERHYEVHDERRESYDQVGSREVPRVETVHTPVYFPEKAPGIPTAGSMDSGVSRSVTTLSTRRGERNGRPGTVVSASVTRFTMSIPDIALVWRNITSNWINNLRAHVLERDTHGGVPGWLNDDMISAAYDRDGWRSVLDSIQAGHSGLLMIDLATGRVLGQVLDRVLGMTTANSHTGIQDFSLSDGTAIRANLQAWSTHGSPIVLDFSGKGSPDLLAGPAWKFGPDRRVATSALRAFDLDGTGRARWEWVGPGSALLVWDPDHGGKISSGRQLFGNWTWGKKWKDGYEPLATLDRDRDGSLAGQELVELGVWIDGDGDGISDTGEVQDCLTAGVMRIGTRAERDSDGHAMVSAGFTQRLTDGQTVERKTWDWISMGLAKANEGTYVWVDGQGPGAHGGILKLIDDAGTLRGLSIPTTEEPLLDGRAVPAFVLHGRFRDTSRLAWSYTVPGGQAVSEVRLIDGGKRLIGTTRVIDDRGETAYTWQAQRVSGRTIGPLSPAS